MILDVARMNPDGEDFEGEDPATILEWRPEDDLAHPVSPVGYRFHAKMVGDEVLVTGSVWARFGGTCTRCGGPLDIEVRDDEFCQSFPVTGPDPRIDLSEEERISVTLALPQNPVCSPDCPGVCPHCGHRLAEGPCGCAEASGSPAWAALDALGERGLAP